MVFHREEEAHSHRFNSFEGENYKYAMRKIVSLPNGNWMSEQQKQKSTANGKLKESSMQQFMGLTAKHFEKKKNENI